MRCYIITAMVLMIISCGRGNIYNTTYETNNTGTCAGSDGCVNVINTNPQPGCSMEWEYGPGESGIVISSCVGADGGMYSGPTTGSFACGGPEIDLEPGMYVLTLDCGSSYTVEVGGLPSDAGAQQ